MAVWTPPRTWATAELVTASLMNTHLRDQLLVISAARALFWAIGDLNGGVINTGYKGSFYIPFKVNVTGWTVLLEPSGSIVIDVWKDTYANSPPTVADTIAGSEKPTVAADVRGQDLTLTTWNPAINAGDVVGFNVDSCTAGKLASLTLSTELA